MVKFKMYGLEADVILSKVHPDILPVRHRTYVRSSALDSEFHLQIQRREDFTANIAEMLFDKYLRAYLRLHMTPDERVQHDLSGRPLRGAARLLSETVGGLPLHPKYAKVKLPNYAAPPGWVNPPEPLFPVEDEASDDLSEDDNPT